MTAAVQEDLAGLEELLLGDVLCEFDVFEPDGSAGPCVRLAVAAVTVQCDTTRHGADRLICESCLSDLVGGRMGCKGCYQDGFVVKLRFVREVRSF